MLVRRADPSTTAPLSVEGADGVRMQIMVGRADGAANFSMRHFAVEPGGHTPRHAHDYEHQVMILEGTARVEYDGEFHEVAEGDVLYIEPNRTHQFVNHGDGTLRFLCLVPVTFDCDKPVPGS